MRAPTRPCLPALLVLAIMAMLLNACAPAPTIQPPPVQAPLSGAAMLEQSGKFADAAREYLIYAQGAISPAREEYQLKAVSALLSDNDLAGARSLLTGIDVTSLDTNLQAHKRLLLARLLLQEHQPLEVLKLTEELEPGISTNLQQTHHQLRAQAYELSGNPLESMREYILLAPLLNEPSRTYQNQVAIWNAAMQLSPLALEHLRTTPPPDIMSGWMELAWIAKISRRTPEEFLPRTEQWRSQYPQHPASGEILAELQRRHQQSQQRPGTIALLLPLSGNLTHAANAIRDGFLSAYYEKPAATRRDRVLIYDTGNNTTDIGSLYQQAVQAGADFVVGPLDKNAVTQLASSGIITTPVLALNQTEDSNSSPYLYQFGLAPEDEARQVAERTSIEGFTRAIVIAPNGDWGRRIVSAFSQRFTELGGEVLEQEFYHQENSDFSHPIKNLLNLDESQQRFNALKVMVKGELKFEPRRRQDADFIFMASFPQQARLIAPQLRFHHATELPIYTTSHSYSGIEDKRDNHDMDGIIFCDTPWVLAEDQDHPLRQTLSQLWPNSMARYNRLYALGIDAYHIIPHLQWLRHEPHERFAGESGSLHVDENNRIHRSLKWARFIGGRARLIQQATMPIELTPETTTLQLLQ